MTFAEMAKPFAAVTIGACLSLATPASGAVRDAASPTVPSIFTPQSATVRASPRDEEAMLERMTNHPFDADMIAAGHAILGQSPLYFPVIGGAGTPPPRTGGAVPPLDREPGVAAPGRGLLTSP